MHCIHIDTEEIREFDNPPKFAGWVPIFQLSDWRGTLEIARLHRKAYQFERDYQRGSLTAGDVKNHMLEELSNVLDRLTSELTVAEDASWMFDEAD